MLTWLDLQRFKNFKQARLSLGHFTVLVGTNASGKSNLRDAFRFLHGIGRGYNLADIFGEKWGDSGEIQWSGIRGGMQEAAFHREATFALAAAFSIRGDRGDREAVYTIEVDTSHVGKPPHVVAEHLTAVDGNRAYFFASHPAQDPPAQNDPHQISVRIGAPPAPALLDYTQPCFFRNTAPVLSQLAEHPEAKKDAGLLYGAQLALRAFRSMRFYDWDPEAMRKPCFPGQTVLGDRGENLSGVLQAICDNSARKRTLLEWVRELTPMDATDLEFSTDQIGRILVTLIEGDGSKTSAYSASDGTLRFLAMIAALLGPEASRFFFIEELDNGIHPARLHLLVELIERTAAAHNIQIVATTHSPQLLALLSRGSLEHAALVYRLEGTRAARIKRILDLPNAERIVGQHRLGEVLAAGWLENSASFTEEEVEV